jgi:retron-type reverse transcriptase
MTKNLEILRLLNMPVFSSLSEMASVLHIDKMRLNLLSNFSHRYYLRYEIPKANGETRQIRQPRKDLKAIQAWILRNILDKLTPSPYATAYRKNRSIASGILPHCNNRYFLCLDLEDFFPSISVRRVTKIFMIVGYSKHIANILARLCTCDGNLPQGAVTSPSLSNLIASKLDRRLVGYLSRRNIIYTRYADDITLSANSPMILSKSLPMVLRIIKSEHFRPNLEKMRALGPRRKCLILGLVKNNTNPTFGIGRQKKRKMRAVMHHIESNLHGDEKYKDRISIRGWLSYLRSVDITSHTQMTQYWTGCLPSAKVAQYET